MSEERKVVSGQKDNKLQKLEDALVEQMLTEPIPGELNFRCGSDLSLKVGRGKWVGDMVMVS